MAENEIRLDTLQEQTIGDALIEVLNQFPLLDGEEITFNNGDKDAGIAIFGQGGALIKRQRESVTGNVYQECMYPFVVRYRAVALNQVRKIKVQDWLDTLGRWLNRQIITIDDAGYKLIKYPALTENRQIKTISILSPSYQSETDSDSIEDWIISLQMEYTNEFIKEM